ncbi:DUF11 domain-containing protein [filamentous cyanobacterium LEGE 11480]|uniref:DUF11 domain-containing protein n=1 Tax=Romeriopsis navalis LEGE 11480 TaxID=2777977 RepID=A0A928Z269_9CYAN|nr:hypothetical protein [Romeriopsis navalis]MBE9030091.1 DUF11 domain-containing protein [Romeriopsis navalis LEGE 11480]
MKRSLMLGLSALMLVAVPVAGVTLSSALGNGGSAIADSSQKPNIRLQLVGEKKVVASSTTGQEEVSWKPLDAAKPGDVIRYRLSGKNQGKAGARKLALTQPVPQGTVYVLKTATGEGTQATFSIDGGKTFVANPTVRVKLTDGKFETQPAPAKAYTHVKWQFDQKIAANQDVNVAYQVKVN